MKLVVKKLIILVLLAVLFGVALLACNNDPPQPKSYSVVYTASEGGTISGIASQFVTEGESTSEVVATANTGYKFIKWSDNESTELKRIDTNITADITATAIFEQLEYEVKYSADANGTIEGEKIQTIAHGGNAETVTAKPNEGYMFVKWSDNSKTNSTRTDTNIKNDITATAIFEKIKRTFTYNYGNATSDKTVKSVELKYESLNETDFIVPEREHFTFEGWYLDKESETQVTDELGTLVIGTEVFENNSKDLYPKWQVIEEVMTHKILMIYVTEVQATLMSNQDPKHHDKLVDEPYEIEVNYKMSANERILCELLTQQMQNYLDDMIDGLVNFEVESYFTTEVITNKNIEKIVRHGRFEHRIPPYWIPELGKEKLDKYQSLISSYCFNDYNVLLWGATGSAWQRNAIINLESTFRNISKYGYDVNLYKDFSFKEWERIMALYTHEYAHTVEMLVERSTISEYYYEYHAAVRNAYYNKDELEITRLYLLNQFEADGKKVGIPYEYWKGDFESVFKWKD